jgi:hypothetical protein
MTSTDENRQQLLSELIDQSALIDELVMKSRQVSLNSKADYDQELEILRVKQQETTKKLQSLEEFNGSAWENIGDGG